MNQSRPNDHGGGVLSVPGVSFDGWELVPDWCKLEKRAGTLGGSLPLRAARHCPPVVQGGAAGYQLSLQPTITLRRVRDRVSFELDAKSTELISQECPAAMARLVAQGQIPKGGYWHRLFQHSAIALKGSRIMLWTGVMLRPRPQIALWVSRAFNRHSRVELVDHIIDEPDAQTPLVIEIDADTLGSKPVLLTGESACVTPVLPGVQIDSMSLREAQELGQRFLDFHDEDYLKKRHTSEAGKYVRHKVPQGQPTSDTRCVFATAWPRSHIKAKPFSRYFSNRGVAKMSRRGPPVQAAQLRSAVDYDCEFDGRLFPKQVLSSAPRDLERYRGLWRDLYGEPGARFAARNHFFQAAAEEEAQFNAISPALMATPRGWSTIVDGCRLGPTWGMRGVIDTDWYPGIATVFRFDGPGAVHISSRTPLMLAVPVPRALLESVIEKHINETHSDSGAPLSQPRQEDS